MIRIPAIPLRYKIAAAGAMVAVAFGYGYIKGAASRDSEIAAINAVGGVQAQRNREVQENAKKRQKELLAAHRADMAQYRREFDRLRDEARAGRVPTIPAVDGSLEACQRRLARVSAEVDRLGDRIEETTGVLERGAVCSSTLTLCQSELMTCAAMR